MDAEKMANLESSLTTMDWLPQIRVGAQMSPGEQYAANSTESPRTRRATSTSTFDPYATLSAEEAQQFAKSTAKPPFSYANIITFAINSSSKKMMTLSEIYAFVSEHFPYYRTAPMAWKVTHSYGLNKSLTLPQY